MRLYSRCVWAALLSVGLNTALAVDYSWSGYGTIGYVRSDQPYNTQRFINNRGTLARDSLLGLQLDAKFNSHWSATVQGQMSPADDDDNLWTPKLSWAFLSWRPTNDWLIRVGKSRLLGYLNSENIDVGWTFDYARLPIEVYSTAPSVDFTGISISKTWEQWEGDLSLEVFWGSTDTAARYSVRNTIPGYIDSGPLFIPIQMEAKGIVLSYQRLDNLYRISFYRPSAERNDGGEWVDRPVLVNPMPGISYYSFLPETQLPQRSRQDISTIFVGADIGLSHNIRLATEYAKRSVKEASGGVNSSGGYVSLRRQTGRWTPYLYYAWLRSEDAALDLNRALNQTSVPAWIPNAPLINASQHAAADLFLAYDQQTWALGASYVLTSKSKLKLEWARTYIGVGSNLVDAPPDSEISDQVINLFSLSYNFIF